MNARRMMERMVEEKLVSNVVFSFFFLSPLLDTGRFINGRHSTLPDFLRRRREDALSNSDKPWMPGFFCDPAESVALRCDSSLSSADDERTPHRIQTNLTQQKPVISFSCDFIHCHFTVTQLHTLPHVQGTSVLPDSFFSGL